MPRWIGNEPPPSDDERVAKVAADLARLDTAAREVFAALRDLRDRPPPWMSADVRMRVASVHDLCELVTTHVPRLTELLDSRGDRPSV
jgi:hypothetical protein